MCAELLALNCNRAPSVPHPCFRFTFLSFCPCDFFIEVCIFMIISEIESVSYLMKETRVQSLGREDPLEEWQPAPVFLSRKIHGKKAWWATVHGVAKD